MASVFDLFRSNSSSNNAAPSPAPSPDNTNNNNNNNQGNPPAPAPSPNAPAPAPANPMDAYSKLWDTSTEDSKAPSFNIDPKIMDEVVSKQDFTQGINPEIVAKAQSGDYGALMEIINHTGRSAYRAAMQHNSVLTDKFVNARETFNDKNVSARVRGELTSQELADTPNYKHPVVRKQLHETAERLQRQNPDASPQEIAKMTKDYYQQLVSAINPPTETASQTADKKATNWDAFFDESEAQSKSF